MARPALCLDTSVLVKVLVPEEGSADAAALLRRAISSGYRLLAPAFVWAEVGTVLRKKVRSGLLTQDEADLRWARFLSLSIDYVEDDDLPQVTWEMVTRFGLPAMYDAAFLAAVEIAAQRCGDAAEFWTADRELVNSLGDAAPPYVRLLPVPG
mgnify:CR=1 FL=1